MKKIKICNHCHKELPIGMFWKKKGTRDGFRECIDCSYLFKNLTKRCNKCNERWVHGDGEFCNRCARQLESLAKYNEIKKK